MIEVQMDRVRNMRDIGGVPTRSGRRVAAGRLYRSASLHEMTESDREKLGRLRIRTAIDLRTRWERDRQPYDLAGGALLNIPLAADDAVSSVVERFTAGRLTSAEVEDWWELVGIYSAPEEQTEGLRAVFEALIAVPPGEAVLFHCRGGKDRTGLVAALALEALEVPRHLIVEDFLLSRDDPRQAHTDDDAEIRAVVARMELSLGALRALSGVHAEWLLTVLEGLEATYGSVEAYLTERVGLGGSGLRRLRDLYLEPGGG